ncbi:glycosyltransferase family 9 protein [Planosporangium flavigriseum]|uniref:LPS biosynthesis-related glycosyltransferase n=1 Tax=Planosporangium flavigriseum TaxID=373681 RepID=A0A8J3LTP3_9ACTN|nr:glycosyltransferase family 9 protein [Planosporangium flavigriseum]NJC65805.1 glycosyltransferase family 9 protein [Planosporangium flavigriseum]GIG73659.1 LPS biosynthesis-related glycosyltransferase [Planosporangium flavigriseum]
MPYRPLADPAVRRVAVVRLRVGLGDLMCSVPALRALRAARPDLDVTVVTWDEVAPFVDRMRAYVDHLLPFPGFPGIPDRPVDPAGWEPFLRAATGFDLAIQSYGDNLAANEVCRALGARLVGGFWPTGIPADPPADPPPLHLRYPRHLHEAWRHLRLFAHLGVPVAERAETAALEFPTWPADRDDDARVRGRYGLGPGEYAVVHPGATAPSRRWQAERFAAVADALAGRGLRVVVTGVAAERDLTEAVVRQARSCPLDLTGATSLGGYALLLRNAALVVCNDTGTSHLAAAVGTPSVTVFLASDPVRWAHAGQRHRVARTAVECNPCPHLTCPIDFRCATRLPVGEVLTQVDALLPGDTSPRRPAPVPSG